MGSQIDEKWRSEAETPHKVTLTKGFWLLETETTQKQWKAIMGDNPSHFSDDALRPVEMVSWNDCDEFVKKLNDLGVAPDGWRFALPTEAQWEYACRAGTSTPYHFGYALNGDKANCNGELPYSPDGLTPEGKSLGKTSRVKSYSANRWGFYDMHGNVWEWCRILYGAYSEKPITNPIGPKSGMGRVVRGGSWRDPASFCRSAYRQWNDPRERHNFVGVRIALVSNTAKKPVIADVHKLDTDDDSEDNYDQNEPTNPVGTGPLASFDGKRDFGERGTIELNGVKFAFRYCRQGADEFWIMESPLTQRQWEAIAGDNPSQIKNATRPVNMISWGDCVNVANSLNLALGGDSGWTFALPSEAQWDFAYQKRNSLGTKYEDGNLCFLEWRADYGSQVYINDKIKSGTQGVTVNPPMSSEPLKQGLETRRMDLGARFALVRSPD